MADVLRALGLWIVRLSGAVHRLSGALFRLSGAVHRLSGAGRFHNLLISNGKTTLFPAKTVLKLLKLLKPARPVDNRRAEIWRCSRAYRHGAPLRGSPASRLPLPSIVPPRGGRTVPPWPTRPAPRALLARRGVPPPGPPVACGPLARPERPRRHPRKGLAMKKEGEDAPAKPGIGPMGGFDGLAGGELGKWLETPCRP